MRGRPCCSVDSMMRAIVRTVSIGYAPTLVSPESITASVPSSTAFATSDASARVGRGAEIIDSSIWVATMTGLALRRAFSTMSFWTIGTSSSGSSTPRSPRATMTLSNASMTSSRFSTAWGFSILAMSGRRMSSSRMTSRASSASLADRTNDSATKSTPWRRAHRRSSMSFSLMADTLTWTPGRLMPLWLLTCPPISTLVVTSVSETAMVRSRTRPSSMRISSPALTSPGRPAYVVEQRVESPVDRVGGDGELVAVGQHRRDRRRTCRGGSWGPGGRPGSRWPCRRRRSPGARARRPSRGRPACRGSCSGGRRPCRPRPARARVRTCRWLVRGCRRSLALRTGQA